MFNKLCIIGVGLIGGSIAKTARQNNLVKTIIGFGRKQDELNLIRAKELNVIDDYYFDIAEAIESADCVIIATPVASFESIFLALKPYWNSQTIYSDVGSTKGNIVEAAKKVFGEIPPNFIPAHPIAGAEKSGVEAAIVDLFLHKRLIITPLKNTDSNLQQKLEIFWQQLGAEISIMDVMQHDTILAATSHLPHLLAFALMDMLGSENEQNDIFKYAAGGFRDFTRIASSDPTMWLDICLANQQAILPLLAQFRHQLTMIEQMIQQQEANNLFKTFEYAQQTRQRFLQQFNS
ncbi:MAG: hypothetical protein RL637_1431 [Pseudomonadota bacterium]|jgi:prephenate dehydrogenase